MSTTAERLNQKITLRNKRRAGLQLAIIVPVYNEGGNFNSLWNAIDASIKSPFKAYIVYDFDEDDTVPIVRKLIESGEKRLELVKNRRGRGVVGAILSGFDEVREGPALVVMADLSDDLSQVDAMLEMYHRGYDLVAGSRYSKGGGIKGGPVFKQNLSRMAGVSLRVLRGIPTNDSTNAFKLYDKKMLQAIEIESKSGFELNLEITVKAFLDGYNICEIPTVWTDRAVGQSKFRIWAWLPQYIRWYLYAFTRRRRNNQSIG